MQLETLFTEMADALRGKEETTDKISAESFPQRIKDLKVLDTTDATATANDVVAGKITYSNGKRIIGTVIDNGKLEYIPSNEEQIIPAGKTSGGVVKAINSEEVIITPSREEQVFNGLYDKVTVNAFEEITDVSEQIVVSETEPTGENRKALWLQKGKNLFDKNTGIVEEKFIGSDGSIGTDTALFYQEIYIPVNPSTSYTINLIYGRRSFPAYRVAEYDINKNFIKRLLYQSPESGETIYTFTTSSTCYYIRLSCTISDLDYLRLEQGTTATEYIIPKLYMLNENNEYVEVGSRGYRSITFRGTKTLDSQLLENGDTIEGYTNIEDLTFVANTHIYGGIENTGFNFKRDNTTIGRSTSLYQCLYGNFDGKTVKLVKSTLSTGVEIAYAIWYGYVANSEIKGSQYISSEKQFTIDMWLKESVILPSNTNNTYPRALFISFKRGDGSTDFTNEELKELNSCIIIQ